MAYAMGYDVSPLRGWLRAARVCDNGRRTQSKQPADTGRRAASFVNTRQRGQASMAFSRSVMSTESRMSVAPPASSTL